MKLLKVTEVKIRELAIASLDRNPTDALSTLGAERVFEHIPFYRG